MGMRILITFAAMLAVSTLWAQDPVPEPASDSPEGHLKVRPENAEILAAAQLAWGRAAKPIKSIAEKRTANQAGTILPKEIGEAQIATIQFRRLAERLAMLGEPAGVDLNQRANDFTTEIVASVRAIKDLPGRRDQISAAMRNEFMPTAQKASNKLGPIARLAQQGKWEAAEKEFFELYDPLEGMSVWYDANETTTPLMPFGAAYKTIRDQLAVERKAAAEKQLADLRKAATPDMAGLVKQVQDAALGLASKGKAQVDGQELAGPAALGAFGRKWQEACRGAMRVRGLAWALQQVTARVQADLAPFEQGFDQASAQMPAALAGLVDADAKRAGPAEVPALYAEYLAQAAPLIATSADGALAGALEPALQRLAARSPEFAGHVLAYRRATADLLRWRRRVAQQAVSRALKTAQPLDVKFLEVARASNEAPGIIPAGVANSARLQVSIPRTMPGLAKLVGASVSATDLVGPAQGAAKANGRYSQRVYAALASPAAALSGYVPLLEYDMLVSPAAGPMTLETAVALHRARQGSVAAAGGQVTRVRLLGYIPHFASVDAAGLGALRLGPLPAEPAPPDPASQVLAEVEIKPAWVQHELMFVPTP